MRIYLLLMGIALPGSFISCRKRTVEVRAPVIRSWSADTFVTGYNKILVNSLPLNDSILAVANRFTVWYINARKPNSVGDPNRLDINITIDPGSPFGLAEFRPTYTSSTTSLKGLSSATITSSFA